MAMARSGYGIASDSFILEIESELTVPEVDSVMGIGDSYGMRFYEYCVEVGPLNFRMEISIT